MALTSLGAAGALLAAVVLSARPGAAAGDVASADETRLASVVASALPAEVRVLVDPPVAEPPSFLDPVAALVDVVNLASRELGVPADHGGAIRAAGLPAELAAHLAATTGALLVCHRATAAAFDGVPVGDVFAAAARGEAHAALDPVRAADVHLCALPLRSALAGLERHLTARTAASDPVRLDSWPVLHVDTSAEDDTYVHDYALLVDGGGNDVYANNAGASLLDLESGPGEGPARGCIGGAPTSTPFALDGRCSPRSAVLLDLAGDDVYGVPEPPDPAWDGKCTEEPLVLRTVIIGAAVGGVGILRDVEGNDRYRGRTVTIGAAHGFGVGMVSDGGGNDSYLAIRNGQGFALVGGIGILHDAAGDDSYDWSMPTPLDPEAPNQTLGAGGVPDDNAVPCDNVPRFVQGTGNLNFYTSLPGSVVDGLLRSRPQLDPARELLPEAPWTNAATGVLFDEAGDDFYRGVMVPTYDSTFGGSVPAGSQGFGSEGGIGIFVDGGGSDVYSGMPDRANEATVAPGEATTGTGLFVDRSSTAP